MKLTAIQIGKILSETTGVSLTTVQTIIRRLGDARLIPRSRRGKKPASIEPVHAARIVTAVMIAADHFDGTAAAIVDLVPRLEGGSPVGGFSSFGEWLAAAIENGTNATFFGVTFEKGDIYGWAYEHHIRRSFVAEWGLLIGPKFQRSYQFSTCVLETINPLDPREEKR